MAILKKVIEFDSIFNFDKDESAHLILELLNDRDIAFYHPETKAVTFPRSSKRQGMVNVVHFSDSNLSNHWYLIQLTNIVDGYYTSGFLFNPRKLPGLENTRKWLESGTINFDLTVDKSGFDGLIFSQKRPYHYFYDQYVNYFKLSKLKNIDKYCFRDEDCFFDRAGGITFKKVYDGLCLLFPCTVEGGYFGLEAEEMHHYLREEVSSKNDTSNFKIWIGITGQKRSWIEQIEGYASIINRLAGKFRTMTVCIDGWTNFINEESVNLEDQVVFDKLYKKISTLTNVSVISLINKDYVEKIGHAKACNYFIANSGTGAFIPYMVAGLSGVIHGNGRLNTFNKSYSNRIKLVPNDKVTSEQSSAPMNDSYSIRWEVIYNLLAEDLMINDLIDEPRVESIGKKLFSKLSFNENTTPAEAMRDIAIIFEKLGDINTAYALMLKSKEQKPHGLLINKKVNDYREMLDKKSH